MLNTKCNHFFIFRNCEPPLDRITVWTSAFWLFFTYLNEYQGKYAKILVDLHNGQTCFDKSVIYIQTNKASHRYKAHTSFFLNYSVIKFHVSTAHYHKYLVVR